MQWRAILLPTDINSVREIITFISLPYLSEVMHLDSTELFGEGCLDICPWCYQWDHWWWELCSRRRRWGTSYAMPLGWSGSLWGFILLSRCTRVRWTRTQRRLWIRCPYLVAIAAINIIYIGCVFVCAWAMYCVRLGGWCAYTHCTYMYYSERVLLIVSFLRTDVLHV